MTAPIWRQQAQAGAMKLSHTGYYLVVMEPCKLPSTDPEIQITDRDNWSRTIRVPRPIIGVAPYTEDIVGKPTTGYDPNLKGVGVVCRPMVPPNTYIADGNTTMPQFWASWVLVWAEAGSFLEANVAVHYVSYCGPHPVYFGACGSSFAFDVGSV